jgi:hypothetical protein
MAQAASRSYAKSRKCKATQDMEKPITENKRPDLRSDEVEDRYTLSR